MKLCEYPEHGGLCGDDAVKCGKHSGTPYCVKHARIIELMASEPIMDIPETRVEQPICELFLCEIPHLVLQEGRTYRFKQDLGCEKCAAYVRGEWVDAKEILTKAVAKYQQDFAFLAANPDYADEWYREALVLLKKHGC